MTDLIMPWRPSDQHRQKAFNFVTKWLRSYNVILADDASRPFSRAGSKNLGASQTTQDILFFMDADMIVPTKQIDAAIEQARTDGIVVAFDKYKYLDRTSTAKIYEGADPFKVKSMFTVGWALGGAIAIRRDIFDGYDTDFVGWGMEDAALVALAAKKGWPLKRVPGPGVHLWHPGHKRDDNVIKNEQLYRERYLTSKDSAV